MSPKRVADRGGKLAAVLVYRSRGQSSNRSGAIRIKVALLTALMNTLSAFGYLAQFEGRQSI